MSELNPLEICIAKKCRELAKYPLCQFHQSWMSARYDEEYDKIKEERGVIYFLSNEDIIIAEVTDKLMEEITVLKPEEFN